MTCLPDESNIRIPYKMTTNEILQDMFTQFSEISSRFNHADRVKCVKCLLFTPQYIEHKISIFNELFNQMKKQKNFSYSLRIKYVYQHDLSFGYNLLVFSTGISKSSVWAPYFFSYSSHFFVCVSRRNLMTCFQMDTTPHVASMPWHIIHGSTLTRKGLL